MKRGARSAIVAITLSVFVVGAAATPAFAATPIFTVTPATGENTNPGIPLTFTGTGLRLQSPEVSPSGPATTPEE